MPTKLSQPNGSLDSTLKLVEQLEASEKQKRRRLFLMLLGAIVLIGGATGAYIATQGVGSQAETVSYMVFPAERYRDATAYQYLEQPNQVLILSDQELGQYDTLSTPAEYQAWVATYGAAYDVESLSTSTWTAEETPEIDADLSEDEVASEDEIEAPFRPNMRLVLSGTREAGNTIRFTVLPYNAAYTYVLDFGTGYKQRIKQRAIYRFDQAGSYRLTLRIRNKEGQEASITQRVQIKPAPEPSVDNEAIAQRAELPSQQVQPAASEAVDSTPSPANGLAASPSAANRNRADVLGSSRDMTANQAEESQPAESPAAAAATPKPVLTPLKFAEVMPSYPGGSGQMFAFLKKRINYPEIARNHQVEGKIYIQIVVQPDGRHTNHKVARGIGYGCDKEALRVVQQMPNWIPGEQGGQKVPVIYTIPVTFALE